MTWYLILNDDLKDDLGIYVEYHSIGSCWWKVGIVFLDHGCWDRTGNKGGSVCVCGVCVGGGSSDGDASSNWTIESFYLFLGNSGYSVCWRVGAQDSSVRIWFHQRKLSRFQFEITCLCQSKTKTAKMYIMSPGRDELNGYFPWHIFHRQLSRK